MTKGLPVEDVRWASYQGLPMVRFSAPEGCELPAERHSLAMALFAVKDGLHPLWAEKETEFADLASVSKYKGKTNEAFTQFLLNLALCSGGFSALERPNVLDPVCGRGTSLHVAVKMGFNAYGIEQSKNEVAEARNFLKHYLTYNRYKHNVEQTHYTLEGKRAGDAFTYTFARPEQWKAGDPHFLRLILGDGRSAPAFFRKTPVHAIVGDLPYGVQHAGFTGGTVSPEALLKAALPAWAQVLAPGGAMALSFTTHTLKRETVWQLMEQNGLTPMTQEPYDGFTHYVEQAVLRDAAVAVKLPSRK